MDVLGDIQPALAALVLRDEGLRLLQPPSQLVLGDLGRLPCKHHLGDERLIGLGVEGSHRGRARRGNRGASLKPRWVNPSSGSEVMGVDKTFTLVRTASKSTSSAR